VYIYFNDSSVKKIKKRGKKWLKITLK